MGSEQELAAFFRRNELALAKLREILALIDERLAAIRDGGK